MTSEDESLTESTNLARYQPGQTTGHYESYFLRANHPSRPLAFWIRYPLFQPEGLPEDTPGDRDAGGV